MKTSNRIFCAADRAIVAACVTFLVSACGGSKKAATDDAEPAMPDGSITFTAAQIRHGGVEWSAAATSIVSGSATIPGTLLPDDDRSAQIGAPLEGRVVSVAVRPGDRVQRGQPLVVITSAGAAGAQSDVSKARAQLNATRAQSSYAASARARAERLLTLKAIPRQDYERAVADEEFAKAGEQQAQAELERATGTAQQIGAGAVNGQVVLRSPQAGVVLERLAIPGAVVSAGTPVVTISDVSHLWLSMAAPDQLAPQLKIGDAVTFSVPGLPGAFDARIDAVGGGLDASTRTLPIRARVDNTGGRLRPQMFATVAIPGAGAAIPSVVLPEESVQKVGGKSVVFIATPDGKGGARLVQQEVEFQSGPKGKVVITHGLNAGQLVVTHGAFSIKAQMEKSSMPEMEM